MVAERLVDICGELDADLATVEELRELLKKIQKTVGTKKVSGFNDKHVGKPVPWDGEKEEKFKTWSERFSSFMATAGDKIWRKIIKDLQGRDEEELEDMDDVEKMLTDLGIDSDLAEELSETLYDQLTQYAKGELLADIQMAGPMESMESYRKAYAHGRKKTAENAHRARNRVTRPEIAEAVDNLEEKFKKWKKDIA
jgi:3-hydroxyacyl-CoA dehydrogenase